MNVNLTREQILLINLLIRIAVIAGIASLILSFRFVVDFIVRASASRTARVRVDSKRAARPHGTGVRAFGI